MQFSPVEKYSPKLKTTQIRHYNRISAKNEALKAVAAYGKKIDPEVVELFIRKGDTDAPDNYKNIFLEEAEKYCRKIFDALSRCEYDPDFMKLYVCGGGVQLVRRFGNYSSDRVIFIDDICATAKGYQQFALKSLKALEKRSE